MPEQEFLDRLAQLRANNCANLPTPELAILTKTVTRLRKSGVQSQCLQVGETAPDFEFISEDNSATSFYQVLEKGPVVLNFFRGYWCQYCQTEVEAYENIQGELDKLGCSYFAITPQRPETSSYSPESYQVIFDKDNKIARQFGIVYGLVQEEIDLFSRWGLKLDEVQGCDTWELPIPATFLVCPDRTIGYEYVDVDFRARCCPDQLIEEIRHFCKCEN